MTLPSVWIRNILRSTTQSFFCWRHSPRPCRTVSSAVPTLANKRMWLDLFAGAGVELGWLQNLWDGGWERFQQGV